MVIRNRNVIKDVVITVSKVKIYMYYFKLVIFRMHVFTNHVPKIIFQYLIMVIGRDDSHQVHDIAI